jgi:DNA polymerase III delta prime subunit
MLYYEKYKVKSLDDLVMSPYNKGYIQDLINKQEIPHLFLYGPPGSGKTTVASILTNEIPCKVLELNGSLDNGIDTVREDIKRFCQGASNKLKIVRVEEADALTTQAQGSLRDMIGKYAATTRFIFTGNYPQNILAPIRSRFVQLEFEQFPKRGCIEFVKNVLTKEGIEFTLKDIRTVVDFTFPDFRSMMNLLEYSSYIGKLIPQLREEFKSDHKKLKEYLTNRDILAIHKMFESKKTFNDVYDYMFNIWVPEQKGEIRGDLTVCLAEWSNNDKECVDKRLNIMAMVYCIFEILDNK